MTQEDKQLLLKDLCARLPYCVRYKHLAWDDEHGEDYSSENIFHKFRWICKNCYDDETVYIASVLRDVLREWDCI